MSELGEHDTWFLFQRTILMGKVKKHKSSMLTKHKRQWDMINTYVLKSNYRFYNILLWEPNYVWGHRPSTLDSSSMKWSCGCKRQTINNSSDHMCLVPLALFYYFSWRVWIRERSGKNFGYRVRIPGFQNFSQDPTLPLNKPCEQELQIPIKW